MHALRDVMARALGDDSLSIAYWLKDGERWVDAEGQVIAPPQPSSETGRAVTLLRDAENEPVAALVHDSALLEEPMLLESVASSMQMALESHRLEAEIKAAGARSASAVEAERHRIERDLHDGAQQRLIALRMKLSVTARLLDQDPRRAASAGAGNGGRRRGGHGRAAGAGARHRAAPAGGAGTGRGPDRGRAAGGASHPNPDRRDRPVRPRHRKRGVFLLPGGAAERSQACRARCQRAVVPGP